MSNRDCSKCDAKCCIAWAQSGIVTSGDIKKWEENNAYYIFKYVGENGVWVDPETDDKLIACPFLSIKDGKYGCSIYPEDGEVDLRPNVCESYPGDKKCLNELVLQPIIVDGYEFNIAPFIKKKG